MLGTGEDTKPQSRVVEADREEPSGRVLVVWARNPTTSCYDQ